MSDGRRSLHHQLTYASDYNTPSSSDSTERALMGLKYRLISGISLTRFEHTLWGWSPAILSPVRSLSEPLVD